MDIATTLLEYGAKANAESKAGFTPLHLSAQEGHTDMSTLLIEHKADTNHKAKVRFIQLNNKTNKILKKPNESLYFPLLEWPHSTSLVCSGRQS